jgi:hypothetical protein
MILQLAVMNLPASCTVFSQTVQLHGTSTREQTITAGCSLLYWFVFAFFISYDAPSGLLAAAWPIRQPCGIFFTSDAISAYEFVVILSWVVYPTIVSVFIFVVWCVHAFWRRLGVQAATYRIRRDWQHFPPKTVESEICEELRLLEEAEPERVEFLNTDHCIDKYFPTFIMTASSLFFLISWLILAPLSFIAVPVLSFVLIEITTYQNQKLLVQQGIENQWGFGQIISMLSLYYCFKVLRAVIVGMNQERKSERKSKSEAFSSIFHEIKTFSIKLFRSWMFQDDSGTQREVVQDEHNENDTVNGDVMTRDSKLRV